MVTIVCLQFCLYYSCTCNITIVIVRKGPSMRKEPHSARSNSKAFPIGSFDLLIVYSIPIPLQITSNYIKRFDSQKNWEIKAFYLFYILHLFRSLKINISIISIISIIFPFYGWKFPLPKNGIFGLRKRLLRMEKKKKEKIDNGKDGKRSNSICART